MDPFEPPLLPEPSDDPTRPPGPPKGSPLPGGSADDWRRPAASDPTNPPPAKPSRPPGQIISRVLLVIGALLMLYVVIVISRALG